MARVADNAGLVRAVRGAALIVCGIVVATCTDGAGPEGGGAVTVAVAPSFSADVAGIVDVDRVRIVLTRMADETVVRDTVVDLAPTDTVVDVSVRVVLRDPTEELALRLALVNVAGDTVFRGGPVVVTPATSGEPVPVDVELATPASGPTPPPSGF